GIRLVSPGLEHRRAFTGCPARDRGVESTADPTSSSLREDEIPAVRIRAAGVEEARRGSHRGAVLVREEGPVARKLSEDLAPLVVLERVLGRGGVLEVAGCSQRHIVD